MPVDYFSKSLQGKKFGHFRELIIGWRKISELCTIPAPLSSGSKGRVVNNLKLNAEYSVKERAWVEIVKMVNTCKRIK